MRRSSHRSRERRNPTDSKASSIQNDSKVRQKEHDRHQVEQDKKHDYVHSWMQKLSSQPNHEHELSETGQDIDEVTRWRPHNLTLSKFGSHYRNEPDHNRSSWVLRDNPLQSPPRPFDRSVDSSNCLSTSESSSIEMDNHSSGARRSKEDVYKKRPRARTRPERYALEREASHKRRIQKRPTRKGKSESKHKNQSQEKTSKMRGEGAQPIRPRKDIMNRFTSSAIPSTIGRVTLKPNFTAGLFLNGRGSDTAPELHTRALEHINLGNDQDKRELSENIRIRKGHRRRDEFDEAEDFFACGHLDKQKPIETEDVAAVHPTDVNSKYPILANPQILEISSQPEPRNQEREGASCSQPRNSEVRGSCKINPDPNSTASDVSKSQIPVDDPESDGTIPTPILRKLFHTGVFDYRNSSRKGQTERFTAEDGSDGTSRGEQANVGGHSKDLDNGISSPNHSPPYGTQPLTEESRECVEPSHSPDPCVKQCSGGKNEFASSANQIVHSKEGDKRDISMQEPVTSTDCYPNQWMANSKNATLPRHRYTHEIGHFPKEIEPLWTRQTSPSSKISLSGYTGLPHFLWSLQESPGFECPDIPPVERLHKSSTVHGNSVAHLSAGSFTPDVPTNRLFLDEFNQATEGMRFTPEVEWRIESTSQPIRNSGLDDLRKAASYRGVGQGALEECGIDTYNQSVSVPYDLDQAPRYLGPASNTHIQKEKYLSDIRRIGTVGATGELDMGEFWRPNPFL